MPPPLCQWAAPSASLGQQWSLHLTSLQRGVEHCDLLQAWFFCPAEIPDATQYPLNEFLYNISYPETTGMAYI
jgi:hypothetical protein